MKKYVFSIAALGALGVLISCKSKAKQVRNDAWLKADSARIADSMAAVDHNNRAKHDYDSLTAVMYADSVAAAASAFIEPEPVSQQPTANDSIRLNVSFYSPGSGINYKAAQKLDVFIYKYQLANEGAITVYKTAWGREGEVDYCFKFNKANDSRADAFVKQVKDLLTGQDRINYKENTTCRKPRN